MEGNIVNYITQIRGVSYKPSDLHDSLNKNSIILLRANNIDEGKINFEDVVYVDKSKVSETQILRENDILICASSGSKNLVGKAASFNGNIECTFGAFCKVIRPRNILGSYLSAFFQSKYYRFHISQFANGANINNIKNEHINSFSIPERTLEEQKEISYKVFSLNRVIENYNRELELLDELVKARFVEMFSKNQYEMIRLADVCTKITDGTHKTPNYLSEGITFISAKNIVKNKLDFSDVKYISEDEYQDIQKRCQTEFNDILLSKSGSLGTPVIVKTEKKLGLFESLAVLKYDRSKLVPEFLCEQLKTEEIQRQFKVGVKGVAIKHLHLGVIGNVKIIVPPLELQNEFASFVEEIDKSRSRIQKSLEASQELFDSLMQEYFG